ncbi:MAG: phytoene desaturase [Chitinophagaceae bacterium]|nr:phytoene desaturase [Chitinophagaceae bacterium]
MPQQAIVIGAGFSGLAAACVLAQEGLQVSVLEQHDQVGGRARVFKKDGFTFDMGPSWYWMPDVMEQFFQRFGSSPSTYFHLKRLDPSYQIYFSDGSTMKVPASFSELKQLFEQEEAGAGHQLELFLADARIKYETGIGEFVQKPSLSLFEYMEPSLLKSAFQLNLFHSFAKHVRGYFRSPKLLQLLEFPVLFLGAMPEKIPALYSMMNYADIKLGTWYPDGGFGKLAEGMFQLAKSLGVTFHFQTTVENLEVYNKQISSVKTSKGVFNADVVISSADYHFTETQLLPSHLRNYSDTYWERRVMSPSCLLYYIGVKKKVKKLQHHNLFFDADFDRHAKAIYNQPQYPEKPLYYVCCPSKTDPSVAPEGMENLFILIPVAPGLDDSTAMRNHYYQHVLQRLEEYCGEAIADHVVTCTPYALQNFKDDYNAFKGNAYGLANTLMQTAFLKPKMRNKKVHNLFYTGQLTVPGPGVPPSIISGQLVADYIVKNFKTQAS